MQQDKALTDSEFIAIRDLVYRKTGIFFAERNRFLLDARIRELLHETGSTDVHAYLKILNDPKTSLPEFNRLINKITITETSFFRDPHQIAALSKNIIPELVKRHEQHGIRLLRIWSAGSSSGEEAYTVAILLAEYLKDALRLWNISIYATDINEDAVNACKIGVYKAYALRNTSPEIKEKYFRSPETDRYAIREDLKKLVVPEKTNLMDSASCKRYAGADLILLRNVLIYFDATAKATVLNMCYTNLRDNGYLVLGQSETAFGVNNSFKLVTFVNAFAYKKLVL